MNKRNELRAKLQACHIQQQQTRGGGTSGPSSVNQIPKAKRPAAVAAISATVPKKKVEHKFQHKYLHNVAQHHQQLSNAPSSSSAATFSSCTNALSTLEQRQQQQQQQSLLLVREAAECAASAVDDAAGDVVVEESGGGGGGAGIVGPLATSKDALLLRHRTSSTAGCSSPAAGQRGGIAAEDEAVAAPAGGSAVSAADTWLYSTDGRQIDDAIAELSLDKVVRHLSSGGGAMALSADHHSPEAVTRLITALIQCVELITDAQIRVLFPALRAHRLRGIEGAEKLLLLLVKRRKRQRDGTDDDYQEQWHFSLSSSSAFTRPPPTKIMKTELAKPSNCADSGDGGDGDAIIGEQNANGGDEKEAKSGGKSGDDKEKIVLMEEDNSSNRLSSGTTPSASTGVDYRQRLADKNSDELLELLLSNGTMDEQQQHFVVTELLDKRPDLLDVHASNFGAQLHALFTSRLSVVRSLVVHQLAHCASALVIKRSVNLLLNTFNSSFFPVSVVSFVAKVCGTAAEETAKVGIMLNGEQCFVLALYVLEDIEQHYTPDMHESVLNSLHSVRLFGSVMANMLRRQSASAPSTTLRASSSPACADVLEAFTRHYRAHMDKLRHAKASTSFFCSSGSELVRRRRGLNMLYQMMCHNFPVVPSKCLFLGMFGAPSHGGAVHHQTRQHITRAMFDRLITGAICEIFDLVIKMGRNGGTAVDLALEKAHQLVQHFRNGCDVQFSRYMPLLCTKVQLLVDSFTSRELKNTPHCALLLCSLDLIIVTLRNNWNGTDDDDGITTAKADKGEDQSSSPFSPLIQTVTIALQSVLRLLQHNRRNRQIQPLCEKVCNAVVQLLKCSSNYSSSMIGGIAGGATKELKQRRPRRSNDDNNTNTIGQLLSTYGVLLGEMADWKALNLPGRAILKRTVMVHFATLASIE